ncbi:MAG TPA: hypothetical protein VJL09_03820, partial [Candidatus Paceibacterota bacterium]
MTTPLKIVEEGFFYEPATGREPALALAEKMIAQCRRYPPGVCLLLSSPPLAVKIAELTPERLLDLIPQEKIHLAGGIIDFISCLGSEVREDNYFLENLMDEVARLPSFAALGQHQFVFFNNLRRKDCRFYDLSQNLEEAQETLLKLSHEFGISLEYLLGNLEKTIRLMTLLGVRENTLNGTNLFHNFQSGFFKITVSKGKKVPAAPVEPVEPAQPAQPDLPASKIIERAGVLGAKGSTIEIFKEGEFNRPLASLDPA